MAIQLDIAKAFDTVPYKAIGAALEHLGLTKVITNTIMNLYASQTMSIEYAGLKTDVPLLRS